MYAIRSYYGFDVSSAYSAEEGITAAAEGGYNLILLDVRLPGMSGIEAIPRIREASPATEIIVMTGYAEKDSAMQAIRQGAYDYFTKPFSLAEMEIVIRRALEKQRLQRLLHRRPGAVSGRGRTHPPRARVITSYSIHYTKLYETAHARSSRRAASGRTRRRAPARAGCPR